jgi:aconitate hydratase
VITDPRTIGLKYPHYSEPETIRINTEMLVAPLASGEHIVLEKGPNIKPMPPFDAFPDSLTSSVLLKVGDDISTDEIMPAGAQTLPYRSNIPEISKYVFSRIDENFYDRAVKHQQGFFIVGGNNYGQGSSREHAAIAPRYLGLKIVIAKSFARIHWQNLINFGILPVTFDNPADYDAIDQNDVLETTGLRNMLSQAGPLRFVNKTQNTAFAGGHSLSSHQIKIILEGSLINLLRKRK